MDFVTQLKVFKKTRYQQVTAPRLQNSDDDIIEGFHRLIESDNTPPRVPNDIFVLLFIIIDDLPFEPIWRKWMSGHEERIKILIHPKKPEKVTSMWVRSHCVSSTLRPEWGSLDLLKAEFLLLEEAVERFHPRIVFFVSESCIPVAPVASFDAVKTENVSIINSRCEPENGYVQCRQFAPLQELMPENMAHVVQKADQWCGLVYTDILALLRVKYLALQIMKKTKIHCSDEMCFATVLTILHKNFKRKAVTYTKWSEIDTCTTSPMYLNPSDIPNICNQTKYLFARKFMREDCSMLESILSSYI